MASQKKEHKKICKKNELQQNAIYEKKWWKNGTKKKIQILCPNFSRKLYAKTLNILEKLKLPKYLINFLIKIMAKNAGRDAMRQIHFFLFYTTLFFV